MLYIHFIMFHEIVLTYFHLLSTGVLFLINCLSLHLLTFEGEVCSVRSLRLHPGSRALWKYKFCPQEGGVPVGASHVRTASLRFARTAKGGLRTARQNSWHLTTGVPEVALFSGFLSPVLHSRLTSCAETKKRLVSMARKIGLSVNLRGVFAGANGLNILRLEMSGPEMYVTALWGEKG